MLLRMARCLWTVGIHECAPVMIAVLLLAAGCATQNTGTRVFGTRTVSAEGVTVVHADEGRLEGTVAFKDGKPEGAWMACWPDGRIHWLAVYENGELNGPFLLFREDGSLHQKGYLTNGVPSGIWTLFHPNGSRAEEGECDGFSGEPVNVRLPASITRCRRIGVWHHWDESGKELEPRSYSK